MSIVGLDEKVIREYIKSQENDDRRQDELFDQPHGLTTLSRSHFKSSPLVVVNDLLILGDVIFRATVVMRDVPA